ncbi:hypothetical protein J1605_019627 [Eschrichtius robustus]|uniref:N-terminal Ras-GEF domain-containing protein n=1 Tax=Eschrichtius robustus TaxID=9764 RepID=A0AB34HJG9_ESCRO|nr:hypothetical protein J1605_019627 [Eschrichtius robustus]
MGFHPSRGGQPAPIDITAGTVDVTASGSPLDTDASSLQEGTSKFANLEINTKRGQKPQRPGEQGPEPSPPAATVRTVKAGTLEKLVEHLVPAFQGSDLSYVTIFLCTYRAFTTTQRVLDLLFQRYGCILPYSSVDGRPQDQLKNAVSSILGTWLDQYSEDFCQPPDFPCLKQLVAYVQLNMPGSDLERRARLLLAQLEHTELTKAEPEGEEIGVELALELMQELMLDLVLALGKALEPDLPPETV